MKQKDDGVLVYSKSRARAEKIAEALRFFGYRVIVASGPELDVAALIARNKEELGIQEVVTTDDSLHKFSGMGLAIRVAQ